MCVLRRRLFVFHRLKLQDLYPSNVESAKSSCVATIYKHYPTRPQKQARNHWQHPPQCVLLLFPDSVTWGAAESLDPAERCSGLLFLIFSTELLRGRGIGGQGRAAHGA